MLLIKVFLKVKACNLISQPSKHAKITFPRDFFYAYLVFRWGDIGKKCGQKWEVPRKDKKGGWPYRV